MKRTGIIGTGIDALGAAALAASLGVLGSMPMCYLPRSRPGRKPQAGNPVKEARRAKAKAAAKARAITKGKR